MTVPSILAVRHALGLIVEGYLWVFLLIVILDKMKNKQINYLEYIFHAESWKPGRGGEGSRWSRQFLDV